VASRMGKRGSRPSRARTHAAAGATRVSAMHSRAVVSKDVSIRVRDGTVRRCSVRCHSASNETPTSRAIGAGKGMGRGAGKARQGKSGKEEGGCGYVACDQACQR